MKKTYWVLIVLLSLALVPARLYDLTLWTDPTTGFVAMGSLWMRFLAVAVPLCLIFAAAPFAQNRSDELPNEKNGALRLVCILLCICMEFFGFTLGILSLLQAEYFSFAIWCGCAISGIWFFTLFSALSPKECRTPTQSVWPAVLAAAYFYLLLLSRFITKPSSISRLSPLVMLLSAVCMLLFVTNLLFAAYFPAFVHRGSALYVTGLLAFLFCFCLTLPELTYSLLVLQGNYTAFSFARGIELLVGLLGLAVSWKMAKGESSSLLSR